MKLKWFVIMMSILVMLLTACSQGNTVDISAVQDKLNKIDAYKETLPDQSFEQDYDQGEMSIRGFSFGMSKDMVNALETLPLKESFTDALDYTGSGIYGYQMLLTYWFNADDQLYSASYNMQDTAFMETMNSLKEGLRADYGEPVYDGYYDMSDNIMIFETDSQALEAIDAQETYYDAIWWLDNGMHVELYASKADTGYDYWVYYTDYNYYTEYQPEEED